MCLRDIDQINAKPSAETHVYSTHSLIGTEHVAPSVPCVVCSERRPIEDEGDDDERGSRDPRKDENDEAKSVKDFVAMLSRRNWRFMKENWMDFRALSYVIRIFVIL